MSDSSQKHRIERMLIEKAMKDESFRNQLIENPKGTIEDATGIKLPESLDIKVLQEDNKTVYLVLPPLPGTADETELSEMELEGVSGGGYGQVHTEYVIPGQCTEDPKSSHCPIYYKR